MSEIASPLGGSTPPGDEQTKQTKKTSPTPRRDTVAQKTTAIFEKSKDTKNKVQYTEAQQDKEKQVMGVAYVTKTQIEALGNPDKIKITVEPAP